MAIYKNTATIGPQRKPSNLGVQKDDPQSLVDYLAGFNGDKFSFASSDYDAGFSDVSAESLAYIILRQAKVDSVPVFQILDSLNKTGDLELNEVVAEILNLNRFKTSVLGFKSDREPLGQVQRNIKV